MGISNINLDITILIEIIVYFRFFIYDLKSAQLIVIPRTHLKWL